MAIGIVKRVPRVQNYAFIVVGDETPPEEVFFHRSGVVDDGFDRLQHGQRVTFDLVQDPQDPHKRMAVNVAPTE